MSASISLLRSKRKAVENLDDSGEESDCSIKDVQKKESIEKDARAIAAINMLTVSMVNQLLEQQGLDPFGKTLGSPSLDDGQSWTTPLRTASRPSMTRSIKENTFSKKSRKSVRFTPDTNRTECTPDRSCEGDNMDLIHTRTVPLSSLKSEPKFTPIRRSKALKAGMLRSLENELDIESVDSFVCSSDSFDSPLPIRNLTGSNAAQGETLETPLSPAVEVRNDSDELLTGDQGIEAASSADSGTALKQSTSPLSREKSSSEGNISATVSKSEQSDEDKSVDKSEDRSDKNDLPSETPVKPKWTHHFDPTSPEHMSPFLKTLLEERAERSQGKDLSKSIASTEDSEDQQKKSILKGVTAFVEVIRADEDRSSGFRWKLKQLGAQVEENFTKKVTHVVFQEGLLSTYRKAKESNVHLVSAFWVMACDESASRVPEDKYPIDEEDKYSTLAPLKKYIRRPKLLSPSLGDEDDEKRLARRLQAIKRRSMKIEGAPCADSDASDTNVAHSSKTTADSKTPQNSKKGSAGKKSGGASSEGSSSLMNAWLTGKKKVDSKKDDEKTQGSPLASEAGTSKVSTRSPRKRVAEDSSGKLKTRSFDSPAKRSSSRSVNSPAKTSSSSPAKMKRTFAAVDSPHKKNQSSELVDSPAKKKSCSRAVDSPVKTKLSSRCVDSPAKGKSSSKSTDSPVKTRPSSRSTHSRAKATSSSAGLIDAPAKTKPSSRIVDSPAKTKPSSRIVDSPAKTKPSSRIVGSPAKTKPSSRIVDSPAMTKSSSRIVDSPAKTKPSSRIVDSPAKTKPSSRIVDSPAMTKSSSRIVDSPAKTKPSSRSIDSSLKGKSSSKSIDSPAKTKQSSKLNDPTNTTSVASPLRSKSNSESFDSPQIKKRGSEKDGRTPVKSSSLLARCSATSEVSGRVLRSTPKKSDSPLWSAVSSTTEEGKTPQVALVPTSTVDRCLPERLSANKASPAKRSLSKAFTDLADIPSKCTITDEAPVASISADHSKPQDLETPWKKARVDFPYRKVLTKGEARETCPRKAASSRPQKPKAASSRSKSEKKKRSPCGKAAKDKFNDKKQTVLTSHFRPLNIIPSKQKVVTNEDSCKVLDDENLPTASSKDFMETESPQTSQERNVVSPSLCPPLAVNTGEGTYSERQFSCRLAGETEIVSPKELQIFLCKAEDQQPSNVSEELRMPSDGREKPRISAGSREESDVCHESKKVSVVLVKKAPTDVEDPPSADSLEGVMTSADISKEPMETGDVCEEQVATANANEESLKVLDDCRDKLVTGGVLVSVETAGVYEEQTAAIDSQEELIKATDFCEKSEDAVEEPVKTTLVSEEQTVSADLKEESLKAVDVCEGKSVFDDADELVKTTFVSEEQNSTADSQEGLMKAMDMCEDKLITDDAFEETVDCLSEEQTLTADAQEESTEAAGVRGDKTMDTFGEPVNTSDVPEEQIAVVDSQEEPRESADVHEDNLVDAREEPVHHSDVHEEQTAAVDAFEESVKTSGVSLNKRAFDDSEQFINNAEICKEQTSDVLEEPLKRTDLCEEQMASSNVLDKQPIATDVLPDKSSGYLSNLEQDGSCDSFSSQELTSNETCRKKSRKSIKPINKPCHYRTRRSVRFVTSDVTD